jgi:hypothetical protein
MLSMVTPIRDRPKDSCVLFVVDRITSSKCEIFSKQPLRTVSVGEKKERKR